MSDFAIFAVSSDAHETLRLKSFSARTKGARATLTITLETDDTYALGRALKELAAVEQAQIDRNKAKSNRPKQLALPAPRHPATNIGE